MTTRNSRVVAKAASANLTDIAMSMCLPHEHKPVRLPLVPAVYTGLLKTMSDGSRSIPDGTSCRAVLTRDPVFPLWMEQTFTDSSCYLYAYDSDLALAGGQVKGSIIMNSPVWDTLWSGGTPSVNGTLLGVAGLNDICPVGFDKQAYIYIPKGAFLHVQFETASSTDQAGALEMDISWWYRGEFALATLRLDAAAKSFVFRGTAGTTTKTSGAVISSPSAIYSGYIPWGFCAVTALRINSGTVVASSTGNKLYFGWDSGNSLTSPSGNVKIMMPVFRPPEYNNSRVPYTKCRCNASAALFTNVGAALYKEGTILAARLKSSEVNFYDFVENDINSTHPSLRYYGPLEKGLYTFSSPSAENPISDRVYNIVSSDSAMDVLTKPLFDFQQVGTFNAIVFTDLGSGTGSTQLAVSAYTHIEFETTSALFNIGVSRAPLESLHAAEVALLTFGHFHENPIHWAALAAAAKSALRVVAPMVAPYVKMAAGHLINAGVAKAREYLTPTPHPGDRKMRQELTPRPRTIPKRKAPKAKPQKKK